MSDMWALPNPSNSPIEKINYDTYLENIRPNLEGILSENPTKEEILRAFNYYDENLRRYFERHDKELKYWANIHTHGGVVGGGGEGPEQWPKWVTLANGISQADIPTSEDPVAKILDYVSNSLLTGIPTLPSRIVTAAPSGSTSSGPSISWFGNATKAVIKFPHNMNGNWVILNAADPTNFYLEEDHGWDFSRSARGKSIRVSPDGNWFAMVKGALGAGGVAPQIYNIASGLWFDAFTAHSTQVSELSWSPDSTKIAGNHASTATGTRLTVWNISDGEKLVLTGIPTSGNPSYEIKWSPDGRYLTFVQSLTALKVYDFEDDTLLTIDISDLAGGSLPNRNVGCFWSPDGAHLVVLRSEEPHYVVIDWATREREPGWPNVMTGTDSWVQSGAWSPLGDKLAINRYPIGTGTSIINVATKAIDFTASGMVPLGSGTSNLIFAGHKGNHFGV